MMDAATIIFIHEHLTDFFSDKEDPISPAGVKNHQTIESAAARPYATAGGYDAYPTVFLKAAALFHSVAGNHSFHNGNKRAALLSTLYFLNDHGYLLDKCDDDEMYEFTRKLAAHEIAEERADEVEVIALWLEKNCRRQVKGERPMKRSDLREAVMRFGYDLRDVGHNVEVIKDGTVVTTLLKRGVSGMSDYDPPYVGDVRKRLGLTAEQGVDSARFYGQRGIAGTLNTFMQLRLDVMRRLAKI